MLPFYLGNITYKKVEGVWQKIVNGQASPAIDPELCEAHHKLLFGPGNVQTSQFSPGEDRVDWGR